MKLRAFTVVYGEKHIARFRDGLVRCLAWPRNCAALEGAAWHIHTTPTEYQIVRDAIKHLGIDYQLREIGVFTDALVTQVMECSESGEALLTLNADNIFGDGSIEAMKRVAVEGEGLCVALAHPRVRPEFLSWMSDAPMSNAQMVDLAMRTLHPSFTTSDMSREEVNTWAGGVSWRRLGDAVWGVTVNSPSIFLARVVPDDVLRLSAPGAWDHHWPSELVQAERQRFIGGSDAAFVVELTDIGVHMPELVRKPQNAPYAYRHNREHHRVNRNVVAVWRGLPTA